MSKKTFFISTPIYYPSDNLHIGHAYCTSVADSIARFHRLEGEDVMFLTGSDEHGQKIQRKAEEKGIKPIEYVDGIVANFQLLWKKLNISNDDFVRTSQKRHEDVVKKVLQKLYDQGDIYKKDYEGLYCVQCESFWLERQLVNGNCCPDCGRPVEKFTEESYFFKLSKYQDRLLDYIKTHPDFIQPVSRRNEMINFINQGLEDLSITRTTFDWGIEVPFDHKHVVYVWFDALLNYFTGIGYGTDDKLFHKFWPGNLHLVGKEIVRFHSIIWPIMLMAMGEELPKQVYGHGWLVVDGDKMSKSKGNVINPLGLIEEFGSDAIRYFLLREINLGSDGNFSRDALITRINSDLANDLGNLLNRTIGMISKYHGGVIHKVDLEDNEFDADLKKCIVDTIKSVTAEMNNMELGRAIKDVWALISRTNKYVDETAPWILAKDETKADRLKAVMYNLAEALRIIAILIEPYIPDTTPKIYAQLGLDIPKQYLLTDAVWGKLADGTKVQKAKPIFPRIEVTDDGATIIGGKEFKHDKKQDENGLKTSAKEVKNSAKELKTAKKAEESIEEITIDDFAKLDLRVAKILTAERVPKTDKLMKIQLEVGDKERTVVSGIAKHYTAEELVGRNVILIANLKPVKLRGIESRGMILAASDDEGNLVLTDAPNIKSGSRVK